MDSRRDDITTELRNKKKVGNLHSVYGALLDGAGWALASYQ